MKLRELSDEEIHAQSTEDEIHAERQWRRLQKESQEKGYMTETDLLEASQAAGILVARNKRLGLIL